MKLSIVIPCYNEEQSLPVYFEAVDPIIKQLSNVVFEFVLVNDGSKDKTLEVMTEIYNKRNDVMIVSLARNFGQNPAFSAGLFSCTGDYVILMDSDLQDPVELIPQIVDKFLEGYDVVNPHRNDRSVDTSFKKNTAGLFYKLINKLEGRNIIPDNVNCFRGFSRRVIDQIKALPESDRYILSEVPFVGLKTCTITFKRGERQAGESKYNFKKMFKYAFDNISSITTEPLYLPIKVGVIATFLNLFLSCIFLVFFILSERGVIGGFLYFQTFFIVFLVFLGLSIVLDFIGLISIYLHNMLINTRGRPNFLIDYVKKPEDKNSKKK